MGRTSIKKTQTHRQGKATLALSDLIAKSERNRGKMCLISTNVNGVITFELVKVR